MTILTIITNSNGHTVYFKEPIKNFKFIKLVSCSLYNSWINLKENGLITLTNNDDNSSQSHLEIPHGHHKPGSMLYYFKNVNYSSKTHTPQGILVFPSPSNRTITGVTQNLRELLDLDPIIGPDLVIKKFTTPHSYFIHCDLMNKTENLLNGKPSNLLAKFSIRGRPYEKRDYISPSHEVFRDAASRDNYLHSLTISVKDENGVLFDFEGLPLEFEIEIK